MPNRKNKYKDMEKFTETRNAQRKRYYKKTAVYVKRNWTPAEDQLVLEHYMSDTELSNFIGRSVQSIQIRRCRLKKS